MAVLVTLAEAAWPGGSFVLFLLTPALWFLLIMLWLTRLGFACGLGEGLLGVRRDWKAWLALPVVFSATVAVCFTDVPMAAGVRLAEPAMLAYVRDPGATAPSWVGPYPVSHVRRDDSRVTFAVHESGVKRTGGFVYDPAGRVPPCDFCQHVYGPWWQDVGQD